MSIWSDCHENETHTTSQSDIIATINLIGHFVNFLMIELFIGQCFHAKSAPLLVKISSVSSAWQTRTDGSTTLCLFMVVVVHLIDLILSVK